ncbi:unnamed protein product [Cyberlindnera jadinii]|uniref:Uncharacterized protein n=1 Tax=Cyberlindnera jadinii (strain ATCC 18201 / CBS 1600 / BCRC 20928 / JCM 3617 / NBRC 0987 / NRRL Y-1542) TaxID=983966 RepID=A0A0H5C348_CYBJN|nr:hypothetical protein CYBJADRAFT_168271 [Cyberlindnera jadinii NRRL Y-1542]ODV72730.1 hypothetical protein CYBJADRAFT_168271 [Cyberlindnera jadinii NRRL Y-1542]CEP22246.1 unnamed protein product [Cyberlindnera jadinii]
MLRTLFRPVSLTQTRSTLVQSARLQSTKTTSQTRNAKNALATKVAKQKKTNNLDYNALSNHNLQNPSKAENKVRVKKDYSALPRAPTTHHLNPQKLMIDSFYAGYRPLAMKSLQPNMDSRKKKASLFDLGIQDSAMWSYSAAGLEAFPEWDTIPYEEYKDLKPFSPPSKHKKSKLERAVEKVRAMELEAEKETKTKVKRGRKRPINVFKTKKIL